MFCKNCYKFNMTNDCIYCGYRNDGKQVKKTAQEKKVKELVDDGALLASLRESSVVEPSSKAKLLKILNIIAISVFGLSLLLQFAFVLRLNSLEMGSFALGYIVQILYNVAVIPNILYLSSVKYREKHKEKRHLITTISCLVIASLLVIMTIVNFARIPMLVRFR